MDFSLSADQKLLMTSLESMLERYMTISHDEVGYVAFSEALQSELIDNGFLGMLDQPGFGVLEGAMLVEAVARCPVSAEVAASTLIAPLLDGSDVPLALGWREGSPLRYLEQARTVAVVSGADVLAGAVSPELIEPVTSVAAYPLARLKTLPADVTRYTGEVAAAIRRRARVGIAAEAAGLMRGALETTIQHVKHREQFGQPLGDFQAIQHRLAEDVVMMRACRSLAFRAAYTDDEADAATACLYAQDAIRKINYDCHQFSGAMGLTLEYPLHLWTYRLKVLQGELGGKNEQGRLLAGHAWADAVA